MVLFSKLSSREDFLLGLDITSIRIQGFNGAVTWRPMDGGEPRVVAEKEVRGFNARALEDILADLKVEHVSSEGTLTLKAIKPTQSFGINTKVTFIIYALPEQISNFQARTSNGAISVEIPFNGKLDLRTSNGRIALQSGSGEVNAGTSNGGIRFEKFALQGQSTLRTSNGSIAGQAEFAEDGRYAFETSNGSIELRIPNDSGGLFQARTSNGRIQFYVGEEHVTDRRQVAIQRSASPSVIATTSNGSISILGY